MEVKTLEAFRATRATISSKQHAENTKTELEDLEGDKVSVYHRGLYIEHAEDGDFHVCFETNHEDSGSIEVLEQILWDDFAKWEFSLSYEEMRLDLAGRSFNVYSLPVEEREEQIEYLQEKIEFLEVSQQSKEGPSKIAKEGFALIRTLIGGSVEFGSFLDDNQQVIEWFPTHQEAKNELADYIIACAKSYKRGDMDDIDMDLHVAQVSKFEDGTYEAYDEDGNLILTHKPEALPMKKFIVMYKRITHHSIEIEAATSEEATAIADTKDGTELIQIESSDHWNHEDTVED